MNNDLLIEAMNKINEFNTLLQSKFNDFINGCIELEEKSSYKYGIQKTLDLNKIYFQGYVSSSEVCQNLRQDNNLSPSFDELRSLITEYENNNRTDLYAYTLALDLYELADDIEKTIDDKIKYEMTQIYTYDKLIDDVVDGKKEDFEYLYSKIKTNFLNNYFNGDTNNQIFKIIEMMLNDIFNHFISGYPDIPEEYIKPRN